MTEVQMKDWIDNASYEDLLRRWRFAPVGDLYFQGSIGDYYAEVMNKKKNELPHEDQVRASKNIG